VVGDDDAGALGGERREVRGKRVALQGVAGEPAVVADEAGEQGADGAAGEGAVTVKGAAGDQENGAEEKHEQEQGEDEGGVDIKGAKAIAEGGAGMR
jgi:hypothetical protein